MNAVWTAAVVSMISCAILQPAPAAEAAKFSEKVLYSFGDGTDGEDPAADLIDVNGTLYGTTYGGGSYGEGTVFSLDLATGAETVLHAFGNGTDGQAPAAGLIDVNGTLYGTTFLGGAGCQGSGGCGTVFAIDPKSGAETVLYSFCNQQNCSDGAIPNASLIDRNGVLLGTTTRGGSSANCAGGCGTVFALDPKTGVENVLYSFCDQPNCPDGKYPYASLIDVKGTLYGTTFYGGSNGDGTVFALDPDTGAEKVLYSFCGQKKCSDGAGPYAGVVDVKGTLYGTTYLGGSHRDGTVYSLDPHTGAEKVLHSFCSRPLCTDGTAPYAGLIGVKGTLYGTTQEYGSHHGGVVFALDTRTGVQKAVYSFCRQPNCIDGQDPVGSLIDVKGTLYGTTAAGGTDEFGTVFVITR